MIGRYRTGKIILKFLTEMCLFALVDKIHPSKIHLSKFLNIPFLNFHGNSKKAAISKGFFSVLYPIKNNSRNYYPGR